MLLNRFKKGTSHSMHWLAGSPLLFRNKVGKLIVAKNRIERSLNDGSLSIDGQSVTYSSIVSHSFSCLDLSNLGKGI